MDSSLNPRNAVRAITLRRPYAIVYCALDRGEWIVQPREGTGLFRLSKAEFQMRYCLESDCPPKIKALFEGIPTFMQWRMASRAGGGR